MNPRLNKKVKKDLDAYFKGFRGSDPEVHHGVKHILIGALRDANFHSEAKKVDSMFPKAKQSKYAGRKDLEDSIEQNHGVPIAKSAKWDGHDIIDAVAFFVSMFIGGPVGAKVSSLKEGMNENFRSFVNQYIKEVTHSYEYEDMSGKKENPLGEEYNEDENDKEEIKIGEYQTKYFHVCPGASSLYGDIESKGVDMDMAERSVRLQDALFFVEEHIQRDGYKPEKDYVMVAKNLAKNIMKMGKMMGLEKEHSYIQGHVDTIVKTVEGKKLEEKVIELTEKNTPTNPSKWSYYKSQAKKKFDVYPSAYANAWAAKQYKAAGGGWRKSESITEATFVPNSGTMSGGVLRLDNRKYQLKKDVKNVQIGNYTNIVLPKGTILYNIPGGLFADHKSLERYETKSQKYFKKPTFRGIGITQKTDTIKDVDKNSKILESVNEARYYITRNLGRGQGKALVKHYDKKKNQTTDNPIEFKSYKDAQKEVEKRQRGGSMGGQMTAYIITDKNMKPLKESVNEGLSVTDERHFGKKGIIIMIDDNGKKVSAIFKNKKNADKYNRNKTSDLKALLDLAKNTPYPKAIDESVNEAKSMDMKKRLKVYDKLKKGDKITIKYGSSMRGGVEKEFVVSKGKTLVGKQKVERIILQNPANPKGVKYYLYQRNGNVTMAIGDMAASIEDMHESINEAEYQGRKVELSKIMQGDVKKFKVYVKNDKGNVVKVNFGQKGMTIKKDNPGARKSFRARMNCDSPGPRWKARYWSCRKW